MKIILIYLVICFLIIYPLKYKIRSGQVMLTESLKETASS